MEILRALVVDDTQEWRDEIANVLIRRGMDVQTAVDLPTAATALAMKLNLITLDLNLTQNSQDRSGEKIAALARQHAPHALLVGIAFTRDNIFSGIDVYIKKEEVGEIGMEEALIEAGVFKKLALP